MKDLLEGLQKIFAEETDLYKKLLSVLHNENLIILKSALDELHTNNKKKEVLILQIKLHDESCAKIIDKINQKLPAKHSTCSVAAIIESLKEPYSITLNAAYSTLISLAQTVKELNSGNDRLIRGSLRAIKSSISFLVSCSSSGGIFYENSGQLKTDNITQGMLKEEA